MFLQERALTEALRAFTSDFAVLALLIAGVTGGLVYLRCCPAGPPGPPAYRQHRCIPCRSGADHAARSGQCTVLSNDEVTVAGRELAAMQHELRAALWRNARLAGSAPWSPR